MIEHAGDLRPSTVTCSLARTRMPARLMASSVVRRRRKFLVVAGGEVDAQWWRKLLEGREQAIEIAFGAVEEVAGEERRCRVGGARPGPRDGGRNGGR